MALVLTSRVQRRIEGEEWARLISRLPAAMKADIERYRRWQDRHLALAGKLLIVKALELMDRDPGDIGQIEIDEFGRPFISGDFDFNVSHSGQIAVCAVCSASRVGVDVEMIRDVDVSDFERYFTAGEIESVKTAPDARARFFDIWTMKECAMKADGRGLGIPLEDVRLSNGSADIQGKRWHIAPVDVEAGYACHIAFEKPGEPVIVKQAPVC
jgi:4'-phosphopantetheinyl transferase